MKDKTIEIDIDLTLPEKSVRINGIEMSDLVRSFKIEATAGQRPKIWLEVDTSKVRIKTDGELHVVQANNDGRQFRADVIETGLHHAH